MAVSGHTPSAEDEALVPAPQEAGELPLYLRVSDIERMTGMSKSESYNVVKRERLGVYLGPKMLRIPRRRFLEWLETRPIA